MRRPRRGRRGALAHRKTDHSKKLEFTQKEEKKRREVCNNSVSKILALVKWPESLSSG